MPGPAVGPGPDAALPAEDVASLLYLRGEDPAYVMEQLAHTDPKLALRIYTKALGDRRSRGRGTRLVSVLGGARRESENHSTCNPSTSVAA